MVGNGYCNDETNNEDCNFDGGECCGPCVNKTRCIECQCKSNDIKTSKSLNGAPNQLIGNGYCNDDTNIEGCDYDGGDCCGNCVVTDDCSKCQCLGGLSGSKKLDWAYSCYVFQLL